MCLSAPILLLVLFCPLFLLLLCIFATSEESPKGKGSCWENSMIQLTESQTKTKQDFPKPINTSRLFITLNWNWNIKNMIYESCYWIELQRISLILLKTYFSLLIATYTISLLIIRFKSFHIEWNETFLHYALALFKFEKSKMQRMGCLAGYNTIRDPIWLDFYGW